jgi:hypothetical protein
MQPSNGPATRELVKAQVSLDAGDATDDDVVDQVVAAVNDRVRALPVAQLPDEATAWPAAVQLGAVMLGARLYRRRNTPTGVESFGDVGVYVRRNDPDIAMLLKLGEHARPAVG